MKIIEPSVQILEQEPGLQGIYKQIELAGRTCYKSEDKMTESSAEDFVNRMIKSGHGAMLEHGTVYLILQYGKDKNESDRIEKYIKNKYSVCIEDNNGKFYITTNLRVLIENNWSDDLQYICNPTEYHQRRVTARFVCDRGVSHELVRHRVFSFAQESSRYCNYSKDKFGNEITFIKPSWEYTTGSNLAITDGDIFEASLRGAEYSYFELLKKGWTLQQARQVLPNALKTEVVMTGFVEDWKHFFKLRCDKAAHPDMQYLANSLKKQFIDNNIPVE